MMRVGLCIKLRKITLRKDTPTMSRIQIQAVGGNVLAYHNAREQLLCTVVCCRRRIICSWLK
jgi:hypothetical protein